MARIGTVPLALAAILALAACSTAPVTIADPEVTARETHGTVAFDGSHVDVDAWVDAAAGEGVVILDVRTPAEYAEGHIAGALNVDLLSGAFESEIAALDPEASYAVYCRTGNRSSQAVDIMAALGIAQTVGLQGGIVAWVAAGNAVTTS